MSFTHNHFNVLDAYIKSIVQFKDASTFNYGSHTDFTIDYEKIDDAETLKRSLKEHQIVKKYCNIVYVGNEQMLLTIIPDGK